MRLSFYWSWISSWHCQSSFPLDFLLWQCYDEFIVNKQTDAWKTVVNLFLQQQIVKMSPPAHCVNIAYIINSCVCPPMENENGPMSAREFLQILFNKTLSYFPYRCYEQGCKRMSKGIVGNGGLRLRDWCSGSFSVIKGNSTTAVIMISFPSLLKHCEPRAINDTLSTLYANRHCCVRLYGCTPFCDNLCQNSYVQFIDIHCLSGIDLENISAQAEAIFGGST